MNKKPSKSQRLAQLEQENRELKSQLVFQLHFASSYVEKFSRDKYMGGAVILQLDGLGGRHKMEPVAIRDGLSEETIKAIQNDIRRSYETAVEFKPK